MDDNDNGDDGCCTMEKTTDENDEKSTEHENKSMFGQLRIYVNTIGQRMTCFVRARGQTGPPETRSGHELRYLLTQWRGAQGQTTQGMGMGSKLNFGEKKEHRVDDEDGDGNMCLEACCSVLTTTES